MVGQGHQGEGGLPDDDLPGGDRGCGYHVSGEELRLGTGKLKKPKPAPNFVVTTFQPQFVTTTWKLALLPRNFLIFIILFLFPGLQRDRFFLQGDQILQSSLFLFLAQFRVGQRVLAVLQLEQSLRVLA